MREKILRALAQDGDDRLLLAGALDKLETCRTRNYLTATRFLDMRERALVQQAVRMAGAAQECAFLGRLCGRGTHLCGDFSGIHDCGRCAGGGE